MNNPIIEKMKKLGNLTLDILGKETENVTAEIKEAVKTTKSDFEKFLDEGIEKFEKYKKEQEINPEKKA